MVWRNVQQTDITGLMISPSGVGSFEANPDYILVPIGDTKCMAIGTSVTNGVRNAVIQVTEFVLTGGTVTATRLPDTLILGYIFGQQEPGFADIHDYAMMPNGDVAVVFHINAMARTSQGSQYTSNRWGVVILDQGTGSAKCVATFNAQTPVRTYNGQSFYTSAFLEKLRITALSDTRLAVGGLAAIGTGINVVAGWLGELRPLGNGQSYIEPSNTWLSLIPAPVSIFTWVYKVRRVDNEGAALYYQQRTSGTVGTLRAVNFGGIWPTVAPPSISGGTTGSSPISVDITNWFASDPIVAWDDIPTGNPSDPDRAYVLHHGYDLPTPTNPSYMNRVFPYTLTGPSTVTLAPAVQPVPSPKSSGGTVPLHTVKAGLAYVPLLGTDVLNTYPSSHVLLRHNVASGEQQYIPVKPAWPADFDGLFESLIRAAPIGKRIMVITRFFRILGTGALSSDYVQNWVLLVLGTPNVPKNLRLGQKLHTARFDSV